MIKKIKEFLINVRSELKRVTWPSRKEIVASTIMVIVTSFVLGVFLGLVDISLSKGIQPVLSGAPTAWTWAVFIVFGGILAWIYKIIQS